MTGSAFAQLVPETGTNAPVGNAAANEAVNGATNAAGTLPPPGSTAPPFDLPAVMDAISRNAIVLVYLLLAFTLIYGAGWLVMRSSIRAQGAPGDSGCVGCLFSAALGLIFFITFFLGVLIAPALPAALYWGLLAIIGIVLLVIILMKGGPNRVLLLVISVLLLFAAAAGRHFLVDVPADEKARAAAAAEANAATTNATEEATPSVANAVSNSAETSAPSNAGLNAPTTP